MKRTKATHSKLGVNIYNILVDHGIPMHRDTISRALSFEEGWDTWSIDSLHSGRTNTMSSRVGRALRRYPELFEEVDSNIWWLTGKRQSTHHKYFEEQQNE